MRGVFGVILVSFLGLWNHWRSCATLSSEKRLVWKQKEVSPETLGFLRQQLRRMGYTSMIDLLDTVHFCHVPNYKLRARFRARYPGMTLEQKKQQSSHGGQYKKEEKIRCRFLSPLPIPPEIIYKRSFKIREEWVAPDKQVRISIDLPQCTIEYKLSI